MNDRFRRSVRAGALAAVSLLATHALAAPPEVAAPAAASVVSLDVARINPNGKLQKPADLVNWVFLGTSLGMGLPVSSAFQYRFRAM